jgi:hypothetical protein
MENTQYLFASLFWIIFLLGMIHCNTEDKKKPMEYLPPIVISVIFTTILIISLLSFLNDYCNGR